MYKLISYSKKAGRLLVLAALLNDIVKTLYEQPSEADPKPVDLNIDSYFAIIVDEYPAWFYLFLEKVESKKFENFYLYELNAYNPDLIPTQLSMMMTADEKTQQKCLLVLEKFDNPSIHAPFRSQFSSALLILREHVYNKSPDKFIEHYSQRPFFSPHGLNTIMEAYVWPRLLELVAQDTLPEEALLKIWGNYLDGVERMSRQDLLGEWPSESVEDRAQISEQLKLIKSYEVLSTIQHLITKESIAVPIVNFLMTLAHQRVSAPLSFDFKRPETTGSDTGSVIEYSSDEGYEPLIGPYTRYNTEQPD